VAVYEVALVGLDEHRPAMSDTNPLADAPSGACCASPHRTCDMIDFGRKASPVWWMRGRGRHAALVTAAR